MDRLTLLETARAAGLTVQVRGTSLHIRGKRSADAIAKLLIARKDEIVAALTEAPKPQPSPPPQTTPRKKSPAESWPLIEDGRRVRWRLSDERGCRKCKRCGGPIIWAQVVEDSDPKAKRGAWMKLDPDLLPHGCGGPRAGRFIDPEPEHTDGATTNGDK